MSDDLISVEDFSRILAQKCQEYTEEVRQEVEEGMQKICKETLTEVKSLSPVYKGKSKKLKKGAYQRSWTYQIDRSRGEIRIIVYNRKYHLVHLLEKGHLTRKGTGRIDGKGKEHTEAIVHVETAEAHAKEKVDALLEDL